MKLRLRGNSIRLRLTRREVEQLTSAGLVEETVDFGPGARKFVYALESRNEPDAIGVGYEADRMTVFVPGRLMRQWAASDEVGIEAELDSLRVVVEKDFACLKSRPGEDDSDMFQNPDPDECGTEQKGGTEQK